MVCCAVPFGIFTCFKGFILLDTDGNYGYRPDHLPAQFISPFILGFLHIKQNRSLEDMMKTLISIILLLSIFNIIEAGTVSEALAEQIGIAYFSYLSHSNGAKPVVTAFPLSTSQEVVEYYVLSFEPHGFLIVAAEDRAVPILAYSLESAFPETIPAHVKWYLSQYSRSLQEIRQHPEWKINAAWEQLQRRDFSAFSNERDVAPLLNTKWDQNWPYNAMCPADGSGPGGRAYAGSEATAMAQIMKYWNFPIHGCGSHSYNAPLYGNQCADFAATTYHWWAMPDSVSTANPSVAILLYHCGVAVNMGYSPTGSAASSVDVRDALVGYFRYSNTALYYYGNNYSTTTWNTLLRNNIDQSRPVFYRGQNSDSAHAFVLDGYQGTNYFHFNWGWSGSYNGYYYLGNLNPGAQSFIQGQAALMNICPSPEQELTQSIQLQTGWNLVSCNVSPPDHSVQTILGSILPLVQQIKGTEGVYVAGNPYNTLTQLTDGAAYSIKMGSNATWEVSGVPLDPSQPLALNNGWNRVAYIPQTAMSVSTATQSLAPWLQQVKGTEGIYIPSNPYSTLAYMHPGAGYWINLNGNHDLVYQSRGEYHPDARLSEACPVTGDSARLVILPTSMLAMVRCDWAEAGDQVMAKVNSELRGVVTLVNIEGFPAGLMQIYTASAGEVISFSVLRQDGTEVSIRTLVCTDTPADLGDEPRFVSLERGSLDNNDPATSVSVFLKCFPNPCNPGTTISFNVITGQSPVKIDIYNLKGQKIRTLADQIYNSGEYELIWNGLDRSGQTVASGVYFVGMQNNAQHSLTKVLITK